MRIFQYTGCPISTRQDPKEQTLPAARSRSRSRLLNEKIHKDEALHEDYP